MSLNPFSWSSKPQYTPEELKILAQAEEIKARKHREEAEYQQSVISPISTHLRGFSLNTQTEEPKLPSPFTKLSPSVSMSEYLKRNPPVTMSEYFKSKPAENVFDRLEKEKQREQQLLRETHQAVSQQTFLDNIIRKYTP